jgi:glutamate carboxypeptidase
MIETEARKNKYTLGTEPARDGGKVVTARRGAMRFLIATRGSPAHSGLCHMDGYSAIKEMARQIVRLEEITDYGRGITANVGLIKGGTGCNVIPEHCSIELDVRVDSMDQAREIEFMVHAYTSYDQDVELII